jgi:GT2 family glycosyltransferase
VVVQDSIVAHRDAPLVDVVVVAYNSRGLLRGCVDPLVSVPWLRVIVVDNASPDDSVAAVAGLPVETIRAPRNGGFAYGCNLGIKAGGAEFVLLLNPDASIQPEDVETMVAALRADSALGSVGPRTVGDGDHLHLTQRRFPRLRSTYAQSLGLHRIVRRADWAADVVTDPAAYTRPANPDWLSGGCVLIRRATLDEVGLLDEAFFLYSEETDLFRRMRDRGWLARYEPGAVAYHQGQASAPRNATAPIMARSRVRSARKHHGTLVGLAEAVGVAIDSLARAVASAHRPTLRKAHIAAAAAALRAPWSEGEARRTT